jgi:D-3-phosphoglycerate dehydrogenase
MQSEGAVGREDSRVAPLVVRLSSYPHRVESTTSWEKAELERAGARYHSVAGWDDPAGAELLREADAVLCTFEPIDGERLDKLHRCRLIVMGSVGLDGVDVEAAQARGITICNMPDVCVDEVAEHTMALLLASVRKITRLNEEVKSGLWTRRSLEPMPRLRGSQIGLIGAGRIGRAVAERCAAFGMKVVAYDPYLDADAAPDGMSLASLQQVCESSDFVSIHAPSTPSTRHLVSETELRAMKPTAILVNTSRGAVVDEAALIRALDEGWIRGAALDVFETEPLEETHPFLAMENVVLTPHTGGFSDEVVDAIPRLAVRAVMALIRGDELPTRSCVDEHRTPTPTGAVH